MKRQNHEKQETGSREKTEITDGLTIKYDANGKTIWSRGKVTDGKAEGYWEWYRIDGTLKRSDFFEQGEPAGEWTTYDKTGNVYKVVKITRMKE